MLRNHRSYITGVLLGSIYAVLTFFDLAITRQLLELPNTRELNPLVNTEDFKANYFPAFVVSSTVLAGFVWGFRDQVKKYQETGNLIRITVRTIPGQRSIDVSYGILLFCFIALFSRLATVFQVASALYLEMNLFPPLLIFDWPYYISGVEESVANVLFVLNLHFILTFVVFLPLAIFSIRRLVLFLSRPLQTADTDS